MSESTRYATSFNERLAKLQAKYEAEPTGENCLAVSGLYCEFANLLQAKLADAVKKAPKTDEIIARGMFGGLIITGQQESKPCFIGYKALEQWKINGNFDIFAFQSRGGRRFAEYDTPAQAEAVIRMLGLAIERRDREFKFPTVEQVKAWTGVE